MAHSLSVAALRPRTNHLTRLCARVCVCVCVCVFYGSRLDWADVRSKRLLRLPLRLRLTVCAFVLAARNVVRAHLRRFNLLRRRRRPTRRASTHNVNAKRCASSSACARNLALNGYFGAAALGRPATSRVERRPNEQNCAARIGVVGGDAHSDRIRQRRRRRRRRTP